MAIYKGDKFIGVNALKEKKVYVEVPEGSTIDDMSDQNTIAISSEQYGELQDAVNWRTGTHTQQTIQQMIDELNKDYFLTLDATVTATSSRTNWTRPSDWPDLDSLNLQMSGDDFIYMTYDNTEQPAAVALHIEAVNKGTPITCTIGHILNGEYIVDETIPNTSNNYIRWFTASDAQYPVVRVTGDILYCYCYSITNNGMTQNYIRQPILERIAYIPHMRWLCDNVNNKAWGTITLKRDKINNGDGEALNSLYGAWYKCRNLEKLEIDELKTQNITSLQFTFGLLFDITELDLRHFNVEKVKSMYGAFTGSRCLKTLDLRGWNTASLTNLQSAFDTCISLENIYGIENFDTTKLTTLYNTFIYCNSLKHLDLSSWHTPELTSMYQTFYDCRNLIELDLHSWTLNKVTNCAGAFYGCSSLKKLNLDNLTTGILTNFGNVFAFCRSLQTINLAPFQITSACTSINSCFSNCWSLKELHFPTWDVSGLSSGNNTGNSIFNNCYSLETITGISDWQFQFNNSMSSMFYNCYNLKNLDIHNWTVNNTTNLSSIFYCCYSLEELNLSNWKISSNCTNISSMFNACYRLKHIICNFNLWDTSKVTTFSSVFKDCRSLTEFPNISNWDYSEATTINDIFYNCYSLTEVTWRNVNLPKCTSMTTLFRYCYNLVYIDLSNWNIPLITNNTNYYHTLGQCSKLKTVISYPIPSTYTNIGFQECENLTHETIINILTLLPQTTAGHTIHFPSLIINSLTAEEKQIATNKNWTIAT